MKAIFTISIGLLVSFQSFSQTNLAQAKPVGSDDWGYINKSGEFVIQPQYAVCHAFSMDGFAPIYDKKAKTFFFIRPDGSRLVTEVDKFKLQNIFGFGTKGFEDGMVAVQVGKQWGYLNLDGKLAIQAKYDKALEFNGGFGVAKSGNSFFIIDKNGTETKVDLAGLEDVRSFSEGLAPYRSNGIWGFIDTSGKVVVEATYKGIGYMINGLAWAKNEAGMVGFINPKGEMKIEANFQAAKDFSDGVAKVKMDTWLFIDAAGTKINPPTADSYGQFSDGLAYAKIDNKVGFINKKGEWIIKPTYDKVRDFKNGYAAVLVGDKWGFIDKTGKFVIEPKFAAVKDFESSSK